MRDVALHSQPDGSQPGGGRPKRLRRAEAKARTRARLLEAAAETFAREGFHGASVEGVAAAAGFTIGALYSNFAGKEDLFLALLDEHLATHLQEVEAIAARARDPAAQRAAFDRYFAEVADDRQAWAPLATEFWLYAIRHPEVLERLAARWRVPRAAIARLVEAQLAYAPRRPEVDPAAVATVILALFEGLVRQRRMDPASVPAGLFGEALGWLGAGIAGTAPTTVPPTAPETRRSQA